ncbi:uncharacterized protein LOC131676857 [Topomyia yanbarensis]|uniref:uncharacterized protein LOC131676857 n=1 Tax=Topomyia yanbarensis TaxID=2498891 RepID=UPI00273A7FF4|nr:uncharacterized protein LOC131676857 [Topomyia yanbarensis]
MTLSHFIEKLKVGKRFVLLDLVVQPECEQPWESTGPENKFLSKDEWKLIYRELDSVCRNHFGDTAARAKKTSYSLDKEYQHRLIAKPNILIKYEFKGVNQRDNLNSIFHDSDRKLHVDCLYVQIIDDAKEIFQELEEKKQIIERLQKENEGLKILTEANQEYTPVPIKSSQSLDSSSEHPEYIPIAINGNSSPTKTKYKPSKIEDTVKVEPDPYTPTSSQEYDVGKHSYVPAATFSTPNKQASDQKVVSSSGESRLKGKRRRPRHAEIFGRSDDDEEGNEPSSSSSPIIKQELAANGSVENIFSQESPSKAVDLIGSSSEEMPKTDDQKRAQLPRKTKTNAINHLEENCQKSKGLSTVAIPKRRRKDSESRGTSSKNTKPATGVLNNSGTMDGWIIKEGKANSSSRKEGETSSKQFHKDKDNDGHKSSKKVKKELIVPVLRKPVDHEKLRAEAEVMRKTCAGLDKLNEMLPVDKSELDVPILNCFKMTIKQVLATFAEYRGELRQIFDRYKDQTERQWQHAQELCYFTEVTSVLEDDQKYAMMMCLEEEFVPDEDRGRYTEFFSSILIMEWGIRIWMKRFNFTDRREALERIRLQEEANPMELTSSYLESLTCSNKKRR